MVLKKTDKEDGSKHAMMLLILVCREPLFPTPHTLSWVDRNHGNISRHFSVKTRSGRKIDKETRPRPLDATQVTPEQSEKASPAAFQCAGRSWPILFSSTVSPQRDGLVTDRAPDFAFHLYPGPSE